MKVCCIRYEQKSAIDGNVKQRIRQCEDAITMIVI